MKDKQTLLQDWQKVSGEVAEGMIEWRREHPKAKLREIEEELDRRLGRLRAKMLEDAAQQSEQQRWKEGEGAPTCPECGKGLKRRGQGRRQLQTNGQELIELEREYGVCPECGQGFFPPG